MGVGADSPQRGAMRIDCTLIGWVRRLFRRAEGVGVTDDELKEIRAQRHDFLKEYYKMAEADLDRHLKGGWQAIAVLAGGAAALTAGFKGDMPLPYASGIAIATGVWGVLTVVDANYWSVRAIAFLANVEAVYFSVEDRKSFNPYAGYHPPFKLLNSLRYLFWLSAFFTFLSVGSATILEAQKHGGPWALVKMAKNCDDLKLFPWLFPFSAFVWGWVWVAGVNKKRLKDYLEFVTGSPGPGMRLKTETPRHVDQTGVGGAVVPIESNTQAKTETGVRKSLGRSKIIFCAANIVAGMLTLVFGWCLTNLLPV